MEESQVKDLIHDIARELEVENRDYFLSKIKRFKNHNYVVKDNHIELDLKIRYEMLKQKLRKINDGELALQSEYNEMYDDWNDDYDEEYDFEDPDGICIIITDACNFIGECIDKEQYFEGYEIAQTLSGISIIVEGDYSETFGIEELDNYHLGNIDNSQLIEDTLYLAYVTNPLEKRAEDIYQIAFNAYMNNCLEIIMQRGEELKDFNEFLLIWKDYLGKKDGGIAHQLLNEAINLSKDSSDLLSDARM